MGFWNALSALAPIAPAMSDAQDLRTARQQQTQDFASEQALKQAQLVTQQMAAQSEKQRMSRSNVPGFIRDLGWSDTALSDQALVQDPNTGAFIAQNVPGGTDPIAHAQHVISERESVTGQKLTSEEKENIYDQVQGIKPLPTKLTPLTGAAGQPQEYPKGSGNYVTYGRDATGAVVAQPMPAGYVPPAPKPASPTVQYTNLLTKQILANQKQGPPLTNEEAAQLRASQSALTLAGVARSQAWAQAAAQNNLIAITDPNPESPTYGMDVLVPRSTVVAMGNAGAPPLAGTVSSPVGSAKKNQVLALSGIQQINRMENVLAKDPNLTGPGAGQLTALQTWLGTQDPDAQAYLMSSLLSSEHGVALFGGRNIHTIQDLQNTLGAWKTNPAALRAALEVMRETVTPWITDVGRLPAPRTAAPGAGGGGAPKTASDYLKSVGVH